LYSARRRSRVGRGGYLRRQALPLTLGFGSAGAVLRRRLSVAQA